MEALYVLGMASFCASLVCSFLALLSNLRRTAMNGIAGFILFLLSVVAMLGVLLIFIAMLLKVLKDC